MSHNLVVIVTIFAGLLGALLGKETIFYIVDIERVLCEVGPEFETSAENRIHNTQRHIQISATGTMK